MPDSGFTILVVCTANLCRSPMAEFLLASAVQKRPDLAGRWHVHSAGTQAAAGQPMHPLADAVLAERGVPHEPFRTRPLTAATIEAAALVLTASRDHRRRVVELVPGAVRRTFTLREFARLVAAMPGSSGNGADRGRELLAAVPLARAGTSVNRPEDDDLIDPIGGRIRAFRRCADTIQEAVQRIVEC